jgi:hypothetical protein
MSIWKSLRSFLRRRDTDEMLQMELSNLKFRFSRIDQSKVASDVKKKLNDVFEKPDKTWNDAYQIENEIAMLLSGELLRQEITARLREARTRKATDAADLQTDYDALLKSEKKDDEVLRALLLQVLENINWEKKLKYLSRKIRLIVVKGNAFIDFKELGEDVTSIRDGKVSQISNLAYLVLLSFIAGWNCPARC